MPRKPDWYANFEPILERLSSLDPAQGLSRPTVQEIFAVKKTEATRVMKVAGAVPAGPLLFVKASALLAYVESRRGEVKKERKRRSAIAHTVATEASITPARYATFKLPKVPNFDDLGDAVSFREGTLLLKYSSFEDLIAKLMSLGKAGLHQADRFQEIVEKSLESREVAHGS
jgi:hypothetical protein